MRIKVLGTVVVNDNISPIPDECIGKELEVMCIHDKDKSVYAENCCDDGSGCTFFDGEYEVIEQ
jgi:hypothetical protein